MVGDSEAVKCGGGGGGNDSGGGTAVFLDGRPRLVRFATGGTLLGAVFFAVLCLVVVVVDAVVRGSDFF